jgi:hypothetical protein
VARLAAALVLHIASAAAAGEDAYVKQAMSLTAREYDKTLPAQAVTTWLREHLPARYEIVWGERITDCGEASGTAADAERDLPMCAEIEIRESGKPRGYLALLIGTAKRGVLKGEAQLYDGYLDHGGKRYSFKRLADLRQIR